MKPHDILDQYKRPDKWENLVPLYTGGRFNPLDPDPKLVDLQDIAWGLAHAYRYGGHSKPSITVAEHCIMSSHIASILFGRQWAAPALLLDACEAYLSDIVGTYRHRIHVRMTSGHMITWQEMETRINAVVYRACGVSLGAHGAPEVDAADILGLALERRDCENFSGDWGLPDLPEEVAHLTMGFHPPAVIRKMFLRRAQELGVST